MTDHELQELKARLKYALAHNFDIPEAYTERLLEMGAELPEGVAKVDAAVLLGMIDALSLPKKAKKRSAPKAKGEHLKVVETPKPEPVKVAVKDLELEPELPKTDDLKPEEV